MFFNTFFLAGNGLSLALQPPGELLPRIAEEKDSPTSGSHETAAISVVEERNREKEKEKVVSKNPVKQEKSVKPPPSPLPPSTPNKKASTTKTANNNAKK